MPANEPRTTIDRIAKPIAVVLLSLLLGSTVAFIVGAIGTKAGFSDAYLFVGVPLGLMVSVFFWRILRKA